MENEPAEDVAENSGNDWGPIRPKSRKLSIPQHGMRNCIVCGEEQQAAEFPKSITAKCKHLPHVCAEDLQLWVTSELERKGWDRISCPECKEILQHSDVKAHASEKTFDR